MKWREAPRGAEGAPLKGRQRRLGFTFARCARTSNRNTGRESTGGIKKVLFRVRSALAGLSFVVHGSGSQNHTNIVPKSHRGASWAPSWPQGVPKVAWEAPGRPKKRFGKMSGAIWAAKGVTTTGDGASPRLQPGRRAPKEGSARTKRPPRLEPQKIFKF